MTERCYQNAIKDLEQDCPKLNHVLLMKAVFINNFAQIIINLFDQSPFLFAQLTKLESRQND